MNPIRRLQIAVSALVCALAGSFFLLRALHSWPIERIGGFDPNRETILKLLAAHSIEGRPEAGFWVPLLKLRRNDGTFVNLHVAEGDLTDSNIDGCKNWSQLLGQDSVLVNSVDERKSGNGGISERIASGCRVEPDDNVTLNVGDAPLEDCVGPYRHLGIRKVVNAAIVVWSGRKDHPPCWSVESPEHEGCLEKAVATSFNRMFGQIQRERHSYDAIVLPAIGTGTGRMDISIFYKLAVDALYTRISDDKPYFLPRNVVFLVWRNDPQWNSTQDGIATNVGDLAERWGANAKYTDVSNDAIRSGVGLTVAACLTIMLVVSTWSIGTSVGAIEKIGVIPVAIGWIASALGFAASAKSLLSGSYSYSELWPWFLLGSVCTVSCTLVARSVKAFKELPDSDNKNGQKEP